MRVPTVLSLARTAAQLGWLAAAAVIPCACARLAPAKMHQLPYTKEMYVFDIERIGIQKNRQSSNSTSVPCAQKARFLHLRLDEPLCFLSVGCSDAWRNPSFHSEELSMRNTTHIFIASTIAIAALIPSMANAQVRTTTAARTPGSGQPWQCLPSDSIRAFNRALRADSLARQRAAGVPAGAARVTGGTGRSQQYPEYDVVLDIPNVCVNRLFLKVDSVTAKLNLDARVANLVRVTAGVDVLIGTVDLTIQGVRAQALLLVDLDDVVYIVDQTLTFVDNHPEIVQQLGSTLQNTVGAVGGLVNRLLLGTVTNALGQTVQRLIDQSTGSIIEKAVTGAGQTAAERVVGNIMQLPVINQTTDAAGNIVKRARDAATNAIVQYTLNKAGRLLTSSIIQAATR
jgi:hypothetical protein